MTARCPLLALSGHTNRANGRPILARTSALDVWTCTLKREAPPKRGHAERIYLRTFRLPAESFASIGNNLIVDGALAVPDGQVELKWSHDANGRLHLRWTELNGPKVQEPTHKGFGGRITE